jgi:signal transduction histidine kinase
MLSIPSIKGLAQFYPNRVKQLWADNKIYIDELLVDDKPVSFSSNSVTLDPDFKWLFIKISSPYFGSHENQQLEYMFEGLNKEWRHVPANGELELNRVSAGNYTLVVRNKVTNASNRFEFAIKIKPWFYNTWWFRVLAGVLLSAIILLVVKFRIKQLKERNRKLQAIIAEQTATLTESNRTKDKIITMVLHDLRSPIRFLHIVTSMLAKGKTKEKPEATDEALALLKNSTGALNEFTDQFFTWATSLKEEFKVVKEVVSLQSLFEELYGLYADIAATNNNQLVIAPTDSTVYTDKNILSVIIRNLLDNANKNTNNGSIILSAGKIDDKIMISVADTGVGMSAEVKEYYLNKGHHVGQHGTGSVIVVDLLKKIEGKLAIQSNEGRGTIFRVELAAP